MAEPLSPCKFDINIASPTRAIKPSIQKKLENSPKKVVTPDLVNARLQKAKERRESLEAQKLEKARQMNRKVEEVRAKAKVPPSPDTWKIKQEKAKERRESLEAQRVEKAKRHLQHAEEVKKNGKSPLSPDVIKAKQDQAQKRRESLQADKVEKAHQETIKVREATVKRRLNMGDDQENKPVA
mmetsp:Transcript_48400/g.121850  ORF Transcript_48400/g.121850 Transcript_48400/m.121850 type:complete len:183 (+) Transcript_48400:68-616(+)